MRLSSAILALAAVSHAAAAAGEGALTFRELLERSELIAVARAEGDDAELRRGELIVEDVIKGQASPPVGFEVRGPAVPRGARAIWFLMRRAEDGAWIVDSPQNAYDLSHLSLVKAGAEDPTQIRPEYFLRREDELAAQEARLRGEVRELAELPPGASFRGLRLSVEAPVSTARSGDTLYLRYTLTNISARPILVCIAETECWHAVTVRTPPSLEVLSLRTPAMAWHHLLRVLGIRPPPPPSEPLVRVLRAGPEPLPGEAGLGLGMLVTEHDYITLEPGRSFSATFGIAGVGRDGRPLLLPSVISVRGAYRYRHPDAPLVELPRNPWEGVLASEPVEIQLTR